MSTEIILTSAAIEVDDETVTVEGNTISFIEGIGESTVKAATNGGKPVMVISSDETTKVGCIKFSMPATIQANNDSRNWAALGAGRTVRVTGIDPAGNRLARTLRDGIMVTDPEKQIQNEGTLEVEFKGSPLVAAQ